MKKILFLFLIIPSILAASENNYISSEYDYELKNKIPQILEIDKNLKFKSKIIKHKGEKLHRKNIAANDGAILVSNFPGVKGNVQRFQLTKGCADNSWDCREKSLAIKLKRSELNFPNDNNMAAKYGHRTKIKFSVFIPDNPTVDHLGVYDDIMHFGQLHGYGDEDVPYKFVIVPSSDLGIVNTVDKKGNVIASKGDTLNPNAIQHGDLAFYFRSVIFPDNLDSHSKENALIISRKGNFHNKWIEFEIDILWAQNKLGELTLKHDNQEIFSCIKCVTAPINQDVAKRDGKKSQQRFNFQWGIYSWRKGGESIKKFSDFEPPMAVAFYKDIHWSNKKEISKKKAKLTLPKSKIKLEGKYKLNWYWVNTNNVTSKVTSSERIVSDVIVFKNGKFQFEKIGSSNIISDKYRKKIKILQYYDDEIRIQGDLDLDTDQETTSVLVILKNNNATFKGSGIFEEYSDKTENIKIVLAPLN